MKWQQSQNSSSEDMDEHDQPTEPMMPVFLPPSSASGAAEAPTDAADDIPMPGPYEHPFPYQDIQNGASPYSPYRSPVPSVYPVLPPAPVINKGGKRPPGGAIPASPDSSDKPVQKIGSRFKRNPFPLLVGMFFVAVQLLLLLRFVLKVFAFQGSAVWISFIYTISSIFVLPFRLLLQNIVPISNSSMLELYTLIAILLYGLLSRLLVRFLKALLHSS